MSSTEANAVIEPEGMLEEAVLEYLKAVDRGQPYRTDELLAKYPQVANELREVFADEEELALVFSPIRTPTRSTSPDWTIDSPAMPAIPGYEILELYRKGGMGVVYKARQIGLDRIVALKMIRMDRPADAMTHSRFEKEGQNVAQLHHPNIISVYDSGKVNGQPYFVLEFVPGENLAEKIKASPWSPNAAAELLIYLADAVQYAHRLNIIHRDLKPANILITPAGVPKIGDFGLSKQLESAGGLTQAGDCLGTPAYMPKEVAEGRVADIGPGTDIFGLGAILYELLTRRPPYEGDTKEQVLNQASRGKIIPPRQVFPKIPVALEKICLKAMAPDPQQRYASASAMAEDLRNYLRPTRQIARGAAGLALLTSAAIVAWALISPGFWVPSPTQIPHPDEGPKKVNVEPQPPSPPKVLAEKAHSFLKKHCYRCHGESGSIEGSLNYVLDRDLLVRRGKVVPGEPNKSRLYQRVKKGIMPPQDEPRPSDLEIEELRAWISAGAPDFNPITEPRVLINTEGILKFIRTDLERTDLEKDTSELDRPFFRYFTITHLYNAGHTEGVLQTYRSGLSKLVNSLSWQRKIVVPKPIDPAKTILRIDLRDYGWNEEAWKLLVADYPYGIVPSSDAGKFCVSATKSPLPYLRADWFVFAAARPPLYHQILELPDNALDLEKKLGVNVLTNLANYRAARAGFNGSGISTSNRIIERHDSFFGAFWISYDFGSLDERKNIFEHPLGTGRDVSSKFNFRHDGGEILFNLPNGLQAYLLVDAAGKRIDKGPINIVSDNRQKKDPTVINGISCMSCHSRGIIPKDDQVHEYVQKNRRAFPEDARRSILALYPSREGKKFADLLQQDTEQFLQAVLKTGSHPSKTEPIFALASHYELELDLKQAAFEAGVSVDDFKEGLHQPSLVRIFGPLKAEGGTVQRKVFEDNFDELILRLPLGVPLKKRPRDELVNSIGMKLKLIPVGAGPGKLQKAYFMGIHEVTQEQYKAVMGKNPSSFSATGKRKEDVAGIDTSHFPVESVSWKDAVNFCEELSKKEKGWVYRLPTEEEWEHACRADTKNTKFHFGNDAAKLKDHAWFGGKRPHEVGKKTPNAWGLYDMHGNVKEWCADIHPLNFRGLRGGSWNSPAEECHCVARKESLAKFGDDTFGFRIILDAPDRDVRASGKAP